MNGYRKLGESEAQCNTLRDEVKQLKAEIEQLRVGGKSGSKIEFTFFNRNNVEFTQIFIIKRLSEMFWANALCIRLLSAVFTLKLKYSY